VGLEGSVGTGATSSWWGSVAKREAREGSPRAEVPLLSGPGATPRRRGHSRPGCGDGQWITRLTPRAKAGTAPARRAEAASRRRTGGK
jgi:hypothetical protein